MRAPDVTSRFGLKLTPPKYAVKTPRTPTGAKFPKGSDARGGMICATNGLKSSGARMKYALAVGS